MVGGTETVADLPFVNVSKWDSAKPCQLARLGRPLPVGQVALYLAGWRRSTEPEVVSAQPGHDRSAAFIASCG